MTTNLDNCRPVSEPDYSFPYGGQQFQDEWSNNGSIGRPEGYDNQVRMWKQMDNACLFDGIHPNDIHQGTAGDCYFLASCASVAEKPEQIQKLFLNGGQLQNGAIGVKLFFNGKPTVVWVDDRFAADEAGVPIFARPSPGASTEVWMMALEKAYAKLHGKYENMGRGGQPLVALNDLTGLPTTSLALQSYTTSLNGLWKELESSKDHKKIISAGIMGSPFRRFLTCGLSRPLLQLASYISHSYWALCMSNCITGLIAQLIYIAYYFVCFGVKFVLQVTRVYDVFSTIDTMLSLLCVGIVGGHAYSVIDTCAMGCTRLVKVRNPWGNSSEWRGFFRDSSWCWALRSGLAKATKHQEAKSDDGSWWMSLSDFAMYYDRVDIVHMDNAYCIRCEGTMRANTTRVVFHVTQVCNLRVQVHQARRVCLDQHGLGTIDWKIDVCRAESPDTPVAPHAGDTVRYCTQGLPELENVQPGNYVVRVDHERMGGDLPVDLTFAFYTSIKDAVNVDGCGSAGSLV